MAAIGLDDPGVGLMAGTVLLVSTSVACDMQQDRSTGWRLGTHARAAVPLPGASASSWARCWRWCFAKLFMAAYPVLLQDQTVMKAAEQPAEWSAAMTYKFVGVLRSLTDDKPYQRTAIWIGVAIGFVDRAAAQAHLAQRPATGASRKAAAPAASPTSCSTRSIAAVAVCAVVRRLRQPATALWFGAGGVLTRRGGPLPGQAARRARCAGRCAGAAVGHEHVVAGRRGVDCGRCAGGAGAGDLWVVDDVVGVRLLSVPCGRGRCCLVYAGAGNPARRAGNFLLLAQKKVTKEKSLNTSGFGGVDERALMKGIDTGACSA